jgi:hypothetical protein
MVMELSDNQDEQDDVGPYDSSEVKNERITLSSRIFRMMNLKIRKFRDAMPHYLLPDEPRGSIP